MVRTQQLLMLSPVVRGDFKCLWVARLLKMHWTIQMNQNSALTGQTPLQKRQPNGKNSNVDLPVMKPPMELANIEIHRVGDVPILHEHKCWARTSSLQETRSYLIVHSTGISTVAAAALALKDKVRRNMHIVPQRVLELVRSYEGIYRQQTYPGAIRPVQRNMALDSLVTRQMPNQKQADEV